MKHSYYKIPEPKGQMKQVVDSSNRFSVVVAARRIGKTLNGLIWLLERALCSGKPEWKNWYVAPTYKEGRDIAWQLMLKLYKNVISKTNASRLEIDLCNNHSIAIKGADKIDSLRGRPVNSFVLDEFATMKHPQGNYFADGTPLGTLYPATGDTGGSGLIIGSPKGRNHLEKIFYDVLDGKLGKDWEGYLFKAVNSPFVSKEEIDKARKIMNPDMFAQEYEADFRNFEGQLFKSSDLYECAKLGNSYNYSGRKIRSWDVASTENPTSDYSTGGLFGKKNDKLIMLDMIRGRWEAPKLEQIIMNTAREDGYNTDIVIEAVGVGLPIYQSIKERLPKYRVYPEKRKRTGNKLEFSAPIQALVNSHNFIIKPFNNRNEVINELAGLGYDYKKWIHDDILDSISIAYKHLNNHKPVSNKIITGKRNRKYRSTVDNGVFY
jgi:predicted phage terminase large subunit-like protein